MHNECPWVWSPVPHMHTCIKTPIPPPRWLANHTDLVQTKSSTYAARPSPGQSAGRHPVSRPQTAGDGVLRRAAEAAAGKCAPQTQGRAASQQKKSGARTQVSQLLGFCVFSHLRTFPHLHCHWRVSRRSPQTRLDNITTFLQKAPPPLSSEH